MNQKDKNTDVMISLRKELKGIIIITSLVAVKLILSFIFPGLKTPAELVWTGSVLLLFSIKGIIAYNKAE